MTAALWSEVTALFGGTFDPPHLGHREAIRGLFEHPGVGRVLVLPTPAPPHKPTIASTEQRVEMCRLGLVNGQPGDVRLDLREIETARMRGGPAYTYDTLLEFRREIPELAFVIGTDQLEALHTWGRFPAVLGLCHWIVLERKPRASDQARAALSQLEASGILRTGPEAGLWLIRDGNRSLKLVPTEAQELSSTQVRESLARSGNPPDDTLHPDVWSYLKRNALYGTNV